MANVQLKPELFWLHVNKTATCWLWTGSQFAKGYGRVRRGKIVLQAHRVAWELNNGPVPACQCVCHRCDTPNCVRPDHLFLGTAEENNIDRDTKGRQRTPHGSKHVSSKLTEADVLAIRSADVSLRGSKVALARKYSVSPRLIHRVLSGDMWRHV